MWHWRSVLFILFAFLLWFPEGENQLDPYDVFYVSDSMLTAGGDFQYVFRYSGTGTLTNIIPVLAGEARLSRSPGVPHPLMVLDFLAVEREGTAPGIPIPSSYIATEDSLYRFDFTRSTVRSGPVTRTGEGIFDYPPASVMMELVLDHPFTDEMNADSIAVLLPDTIGDQPCHVFRVYYAGGESVSVWYISMYDLLPRGVERIHDGGGELLEIWDLVLPRRLIAAGEAAPDILLADLEGFVNRISFPRERPVLLLFFTSGGSNSLAALGTAAGLVGEDMDIYGISVMETGDLEFRLSSLDIPFPVLIYGEGASEEYHIEVLPTAILVERDGTVAFSTGGTAGMNADSIRCILASVQR